MADAELGDLRQKLNRLGVKFDSTDVAAAGQVGLLADESSGSARAHHKSSAAKLEAKNRRDVSELLEKIDRVEVAIGTAEAMNNLARDQVDAGMQGPPILKPSKHSPPQATRPNGKAKPSASQKPKLPKAALMSSAIAAAASRPHGGTHAVSKSQQHLRGLPMHTPLSSVLAQFKESEGTWAHEKVRLRKEADEARQRASKCELELKNLSRQMEHKGQDVKALKSALKNRDSQLAAAGERIRELEEALARSQEDSALRIAALNSERDDLKALLLATLQRLEAVDEMVTRADVSSTVMQDKMKDLEEERLRALEAAARARAEVQELTESRRKLQWQSKLLEKMSEVQMKHNRHKSEAIKKLLSHPHQSEHELDDVSRLGDADLHHLGEEPSLSMDDLSRMYRSPGARGY